MYTSCEVDVFMYLESGALYDPARRMPLQTKRQEGKTDFAGNLRQRSSHRESILAPAGDAKAFWCFQSSVASQVTIISAQNRCRPQSDPVTCISKSRRSLVGSQFNVKTPRTTFTDFSQLFHQRRLLHASQKKAFLGRFCGDPL